MGLFDIKSENIEYKKSVYRKVINLKHPENVPQIALSKDGEEFADSIDDDITSIVDKGLDEGFTLDQISSIILHEVFRVVSLKCFAGIKEEK